MPTRRTSPPGARSGVIDQTPSSPVAYDDQGRICDSAIRTVKNQHDARWTRTRERAAECRQLLAGDLPLVMPENFQLANADAFAADLPTTYTRAAELLALLLQKRCDIKRYQTTGSQEAKDAATKLEQILTAVMEDPDTGYPWFATCDITQNDSLGCVITQPMPTFWEQAPDWQDPDSKTFKDEYQRDGKGKPKRYDDNGFRPNKKASKKAYEASLEDWLANHPPILYREFGPSQITPIFGPGYRVDAVIVSGTYQRTHEMPMQFLWGTGDHLSPSDQASDSGQSTASGANYGSYGEVEILEYWGYDKDRKPYVSYCVDGMATRYRDSGDPAVLDLSPYCSRLPVSIQWGGHWPGASVGDNRALPFMWPFLQSARQANAIATGIAVALWWAGFPTYVTDRSAAAVPLSPGTTPRTLDIEPLKLIETDGPVTRLQGGDVSKDAALMLQLLLGENEKAMPSDQATGKGDTSGFEKTIARAYSEDAQFMILEGIRKHYEASASFTLEILTNIAKQKKRPVLVYYSDEVLTPQEQGVTSKRVMLELTPDLAGNQWKVTAEYPPSMSIAERQQSAELVERRLKTRRKHLEDDGDKSPERTMAEIEAEDLVASPLGQEQRWELVAKILGDSRMAEKIKLVQQQRISQGEDGSGGLPFALAEGFEEIFARRAAAEAGPNGGSAAPMPAPMGGMQVAGVAPGTPQGGAMTGLGGSSAAQSALAGTVGGQMQAGPIATAERAGGLVPEGLGG